MFSGCRQPARADPLLPTARPAYNGIYVLVDIV